MTEKIIDSHYFKANVRDGPWGTILGTPRQGTPVELTGETSGDWVRGTLDIEGDLISAFVSNTVLRDPISEVREDLMRECIAQFYRFREGAAQEHHDPFSDYVAEYWRLLGEPYTGENRDVPWSAAFISWVVRKSGGYSGFKYSIRHSNYVHHAINARLTHDENAPFWGFQLHEHRPQLGDMVCAWRLNAIDYDHAATHDQFPSHCDIIVRITDTAVKTIGGNVRQSVNRDTFNLDANGFLKPEKNVYAVLRNNR